MKKTIRNYWITKCILKYIVFNVIALSSASSNRPLKFTSDQSLPLSNNYDTVISEHENEPTYKTSVAFNYKNRKDTDIDNDKRFAYNTDNFDDDTNILAKNETNIVNNDQAESETVFNEHIDKTNEQEITNSNVTTIYLAGYDDEIIKLKLDIEEKGEGTELLICFYLCKDLHYNDLGCVYTDIKNLQDVSWKYSHIFCVDSQFLKPTWCLDDVYATYNFPKRKETTDGNDRPLQNIEYTVNGMCKNKIIKPKKSNINYINNIFPLKHSKYFPNTIRPIENDLQDTDINIDINQKLKELGITRKNVNTRYLNPNYYNTQDYIDPNSGIVENPLRKENKRTNSSIYPTTFKNMISYNHINDKVDDGNDLNYAAIIHSTEPDIIPNINNDENNDNELENFRKTETTDVLEDSIPSFPETVNGTYTNEANVLQCGNYSLLTNKIATNANDSNYADYGRSDSKVFDENLTNFTACETDKLGPLSIEIIVEDNPLYRNFLPDIGTQQPNLDKIPLTAIYNNIEPPPLYNNKLKNILVPSNLNEAKDIFGQPEYSVERYLQQPSDSIKINSIKLPNNVQNKQPNKLSSNLPNMYNYAPWPTSPYNACVVQHEYPVSCVKNNILLGRLPSTSFKFNQRAEDSFRSIINEKIALENNLGIKQHRYDVKPSAEESRVSSYQNSDLKDNSYENVDLISARRNPTTVDHLYPATGIIDQSYNDISPLYGHYKCSKPQDTQRYFKNNVYLDAQNTHMNDLTKCNSYSKIHPTNSNILNESYQTFCKKIIDTKDIDSSTLTNVFPTVSNLQNKSLVTSTYSKFKPKHLRCPYSFAYGQGDVPYLLKTKKNLSKLTDIYSAVDFIPSFLYPFKYISTDKTLRELQNRQNSNIFQPRKIDSINPILYATSKKVNFLSELSYDLPLESAYDRSNKKNPYFPNAITSVTSSLNLKSSQKTSVMYPNQNDNIFPMNVLPSFGSPFVSLYSPTKSLPIASLYTKSLYNFMDVYGIGLTKFLEGKIYPYYFIGPIIMYPNNYKTSLPASIHNKTRLVAPMPSLPSSFTDDFNSNGIPAPILSSPTSTIKDYSSKVFTLPVAPLLNANKGLGENNLPIPISSMPIQSIPILSPLDRGPMPIPVPIQSLPTFLNKDQILKAYPLLSSYPQTLLNQDVNSNRLPDFLSFSPTTPYTDLSSKAFALPISAKKELNADSLRIPTSPVPISSWSISLTSNHVPKLIPEPIKTSTILSKPNVSSKDFSPTFSTLPASSNEDLTSPLATSSLPISITQPRTKTFLTPPNFLPVLVKPDNHLKEFPTAASSLPITPNKDFSLKGFPASVSFFPYSSNKASNSKGSVIPMSSLPVTANNEEGRINLTTPIPSTSERKPETITMPKSLLTSSNLDHRLKDFYPSILTWPILSTSDRKPKTMPVPIQSLPISSNLGLCLKDLRTPIYSPLETEIKTPASPVLPLPSSSVVEPIIPVRPFSSLPISSTSEMRSKSFLPNIPCLPISSNIGLQPKIITHPIPYSPITSNIEHDQNILPSTYASLPISSTLGIKPKYISGHIQSLPISTNIDTSPKTLTTPIYSLPTSSNKDINLKGFSPTNLGLSWPFTSTSEIKPNVIPTPIQSLPIASDYLISNKIPSSISSSSELKPGTPKPYQFVPVPSNINRCLNGFPIPFTSLPISLTREFVTKNLSLPVLPLPSSNIGDGPKNFVTPFSYSTIPSTSKIASKSFPSSVPYLTSDPELQPKIITPCMPSLPVSPNTELGHNNLPSPCLSLPNPSTIGLNPKHIPFVQYWPISSNLDVNPKSFTLSLPKMRTSSNVNLNSKDSLPPLSNLPHSPDKDLKVNNFAPTNLSWIFPSNLDVKPKTNQFVPILPYYKSWQGVPSRISALPSLSTLENKPKIFPAPTESMPISANTDSPCLVSSWPKYISPDLNLPILKSSEIGLKTPLNKSNARFDTILIEPHQTYKNQPTFAENRDLRYPQEISKKLPNVFYLQPTPSATFPTPKSPFTKPITYPIISHNPFHQRPFIPNYFPCKAINDTHSKPSLKSPVPYSLISNVSPSETIMIPNSNSYPQADQYYSNLELMPKPLVTVLNNTVSDSFIANSLQSQYPCKAEPKSTVTVQPQTPSTTYSYLPFESNQELEIIPLSNNTAQPYLDTYSLSSTPHYHKSTPQLDSNVLRELEEIKLKSIPIPESLNLRKPFHYPIFKSTIKTPPVLIPQSDTEENESNITLKLQNEIQEHLVPSLSDASEYPFNTDRPIFASKFEPIYSKSRLPSTSQTLLTIPSDYKEKLIKVSPYNSKVPIQPSNEEVLIPYLSLPCRKTPINFDAKHSGSVKYPQYKPREICNPIQWNLQRIADTQVPKSNNEIYDITDSKLTPPYALFDKIYNVDKLNDIIIPIRGTVIVKYEPNDLIKTNIKTNNPDIELKVWTSKLRLLKARIVLDEVELMTFNFVPIVKNISNYKPEMILDTVKRYVEKHYGEPIVLTGMPSFYKPYAFIDDLTKKTGDIVYLIWPTNCQCFNKNCC